MDMMPQSVGHAPFYFYPNDAQAQRAANGNHMYMTGPATPVYSRPGSSCAQPPTLYSNGPAVAKPSIMLDTDFDTTYFPSTPPLSSSGSAAGSPSHMEMLQTPMNPMFSGIDGVKEIEAEPVLDWSRFGSPPMTPVYLQSQPGKAPSLNATTSDLSTLSCPSLSPSPVPYARSITASEHDVDFCDPRNLTVTSAPASAVSASLSPELSVGVLDHVKIEQPKPSAPNSTFDFNPVLPHGLATFEELSDLESEEDFVNSLVNLGEPLTDIGRPRACTGSSVVSLGHGSCFGDEDLSFEDDFKFPPLPSPPTEDSHKDKRQKNSRSKDTTTSAVPIMATVATTEQTAEDQTPDLKDDATESNESSGSEQGDSPGTPMAAPPTRRGRKQSLTEDPSKTFVCELCNRRFRRQEHLKRHYRSLHTDDKPYNCDECGKKFSRSDNLTQHARTHAGGALVLGILEEGETGYDGSMMGLPAPQTQDDGLANMSNVLFQFATEVPGSSDEESFDGSDNGSGKRKRTD